MTFCSCERRSAWRILRSALRLLERLLRRQAALPQVLLAAVGVLRPASARPSRSRARAAAGRLTSAPPASDASLRWTAERRLRGSIWRRNCPLSTRSPSSTARSVTRPIVSALMLTNRFGWILPDAETMRLEVALLDRLGVDRDAFDPLELEVGEGDRAQNDDDPGADQDLLLPAHAPPIRLMMAATTTAITAYTPNSARRDRLRPAAVEHCRARWPARTATR